jgi:methylamine dehydrogenase accessory protein MauD
MEGIWLVSYISLWILVGLLILAVVVLARQIGVLHNRLAPVGARTVNAGPEIGDKAPEVSASDLSDRKLMIGQAKEKATLLIFVTPTCGSCIALGPAIKSLWKSERDQLEIVLVSLYSTIEEAGNFLKQNNLSGVTCTASPNVGIQYQVSSPPYAILLDESGTVRAKGIANKLEHLESILNSINLGYSSMEEWMKSNPIEDSRKIFGATTS